jgi:hypothetical protein
MVNLPIGEGFDPLLIEHGLIDAELGLVTIYGFSDEGWVTGSITTASETYAFMWNFHSDELFRFRDPQFAGDMTRATAIGPDGWAIVEVNPGGTVVEATFRWDGTSLEPLDPRGGVFSGSFPMVDINASGQAVGGQLVRINDAGQVVQLRLGPRVHDPSRPDCNECYVNPIELWRGDPLHIEGDYDASGKVDQGDLDLVLLHWGGDALPDDWYHDFPDLPIDQAELDTVLLRWGRFDGTPVLPAPGSVPEPATLTAVLTALVATGLTRLVGRFTRCRRSQL